MSSYLGTSFCVVFLSLILFIPIVSRLRPEDVLVAGGLMLLMFLVYQYDEQIRVPRFVLYIVPYFVIITFGIVYQDLILGYSIANNSVIELIRPLRLVVIAILITTIIRNLTELSRYISILLVLTLFASVFSIIQGIIILQFGSEVEPFARYYAGIHLRTLENQYRFFGVTGNPNRLAMTLVPGATVAISILYQKYATDVNYSNQLVLLSLITALFTLLTIALTQSRGGAVALIAAVGASIAMISYINGFSFFRIFQIFIILFISVLALWYINAIPSRYGVLLRPWTAETLQIRYERWSTRFEMFETTPTTFLFGYGPQKEFFATFRGVDGEWPAIIFRNGIIGAGAFFLFYLAIIRDSIARTWSDPLDLMLAAVSVGLVFAAISFGIVSQVYHNQRLIALFVSIWAAGSSVPLICQLEIGEAK